MIIEIWYATWHQKSMQVVDFFKTLKLQPTVQVDLVDIETHFEDALKHSVRKIPLIVLTNAEGDFLKSSDQPITTHDELESWLGSERYGKSIINQ